MQRQQALNSVSSHNSGQQMLGIPLRNLQVSFDNDDISESNDHDSAINEKSNTTIKLESMIKNLKLLRNEFSSNRSPKYLYPTTQKNPQKIRLPILEQQLLEESSFSLNKMQINKNEQLTEDPLFQTVKSSLKQKQKSKL